MSRIKDAEEDIEYLFTLHNLNIDSINELFQKIHMLEQYLNITPFRFSEERKYLPKKKEEKK